MGFGLNEQSFKVTSRSKGLGRVVVLATSLLLLGSLSKAQTPSPSMSVDSSGNLYLVYTSPSLGLVFSKYNASGGLVYGTSLGVGYQLAAQSVDGSGNLYLVPVHVAELGSGMFSRKIQQRQPEDWFTEPAWAWGTSWPRSRWTAPSGQSLPGVHVAELGSGVFQVQRQRRIGLRNQPGRGVPARRAVGGRLGQSLPGVHIAELGFGVFQVQRQRGIGLRNQPGRGVPARRAVGGRLGQSLPGVHIAELGSGVFQVQRQRRISLRNQPGRGVPAGSEFGGRLGQSLPGVHGAERGSGGSSKYNASGGLVYGTSLGVGYQLAAQSVDGSGNLYLVYTSPNLGLVFSKYNASGGLVYGTSLGVGYQLAAQSV